MHNHEHKIMYGALILALLLCLGLALWVIVLLVGVDERALNGSVIDEDAVVEADDEQMNDGVINDIQRDEDGTMTDIVLEDSDGEGVEQGDQIDEGEDADTEHQDNIVATKYLLTGGSIGIELIDVIPYLRNQNEFFVASGVTDLLVVEQGLIATSQNSARSYELMRDEMIQNAGATVIETCRRTLIDGVSAECFQIRQNHALRTAYVLQSGRYVFLVTVDGLEARKWLDELIIYPDENWKDGAVLINETS